MHERIRFIAHEGNQILFVDFSNCSADEVQTIARTVPDYVTTKPRGSVLLSRYIAQGRAGRKSGTSSAGPRGTGPAEGRFCAEEAPRGLAESRESFGADGEGTATAKLRRLPARRLHVQGKCVYPTAGWIITGAHTEQEGEGPGGASGTAGDDLRADVRTEAGAG